MATIPHTHPNISEVPLKTPKQLPRLNLEFLNGIRGLAALYVMLRHTFQISLFNGTKLSSTLSPRFVELTSWLNFPHCSVAIFIVLSGFCLMLPVAASSDRQLRGGLKGFFARRAQRILPPYYAMLVFVVAMLFVHIHKEPSRSHESLSLLDFGAHALLIQNLSFNYSRSFDPPMWTVAWEWQMYFIFALFFLPIWRRFGIIWTVAIGFVLGFLPQLLLPTSENFNWTCPWYMGLFAMGMLGATIARNHDRKVFDRQRLALYVLLGSLAVFSALDPVFIHDSGKIWMLDPFVGLSTVLLILICANGSCHGFFERSIIKVLESPCAVVLGTFSYTLYLVHYPFIQRIDDILRTRHISNVDQFFISIGISIPLCLVFAYVVHLVIEKPFFTSSAAKKSNLLRQLGSRLAEPA